MSSERYTAAQVRGVTNTSDWDPRPEETPERPDVDQPTIERSVFGEIEVLIPGMGEGTDACSTYQPVQFCDDEHHVHFGEHLCGRRECPNCWSGQWAGPRTVNVVSRLAGARYAHLDGLDRRLLHVQVSPEPGDIESVEEMFEARSKAVEIAKEHGVRGGVTVVHPYRPTKETKRRFRESDYDKTWNFIRENEYHWFAQVYWSPHYHIIGLCRDFEAAESREDGWVIQNLSTGKGVKPNPRVDRRFSPFKRLSEDEPYEDMIQVVRYLLSHTGIVGERQSVTWFGELHSTNFCPDPKAARGRKTEPELGPLSRGAWDTICRKVEELEGDESDRSEDEEVVEEEKERCPCEDCEGYLHPIYDVIGYIDQSGSDLSEEALVRLRQAFDWAVRDEDEMPIGGWPTVSTRQAAEQEFESMLPEGYT